MASRTKRTHRIRAERDCAQLYPCTHCSTERIVAPLSVFVQFSRQHPGHLPGFAFEQLRPICGAEGMVAMCPGCFCITTDLSNTHEH